MWSGNLTDERAAAAVREAYCVLSDADWFRIVR